MERHTDPSTGPSTSTGAESSPLAIAVLVGSTRPGRRAASVADWVMAEAVAHGRSDARFEVLDLADHDLPIFDEPDPPIWGRYVRPHTLTWARAVDAFDGYVIVSPEYNHSMPGALKNAMDFLFEEWADKAAGFVTYGVDAGGARAAEHLRLVASEVRLATVRAQVALSIMDDFGPDGEFSTAAPRAYQADKLAALLDQVVAWGSALRTLRVPVPG